MVVGNPAWMVVERATSGAIDRACPARTASGSGAESVHEQHDRPVDRREPEAVGLAENGAEGTGQNVGEAEPARFVGR